MTEKFDIEEKIVEVLKTVYDPEIPVDIYNLGLIYKIDVDVRLRVEALESVKSATVNLVFEPEWNKDMMSDEAKLELGLE